MEKGFKQGYRIFLLGVVCFALGISDIEVVAKEFNVTKDIKVRIWNNDLTINPNGLLYIKVGTRTLELNCSVPESLENSMLSWRQGSRWLDKSSQLLMGNNTLLLTIKQVITWDLNGSIFWCGPRLDNLFQNVEGSQVTIITGDLPRPPTDITHNIVDLRLYEININWEAAAYTGSLPAHYEVIYTPCSNTTYCQGRRIFCTIPHIIGKAKYNCSKLRENMTTLGNLRDLYRVTVATVNPLGQSKGSEFNIDADLGGVNNALYPTPRPPLNFRVAKFDSNFIILVWKARESWHIVETKYTVLYNDTNHTNKTKEINGQTTMMLRKDDGIKPYTIYLIYVVVQFIDNNNRPGSYSEPHGPIVVHTLEGKPDTGPDIHNISSSIYPHNTTKRNATLSLKASPSSKWHGKPVNFEVRYGVGQNMKEKLLVDCSRNIPSQVVLTGLDSGVSYTTSIALCNSKECGNYGNKMIIEPIQAYSGSVQKDPVSYTTYAVIGVIVFFISVLVIVVPVYLIKRSYTIARSNRSSLTERVGNLDVVYEEWYLEPEHPSCSGEYDIVVQKPM